ncbi:GerW family sporulation protein [Paenibacillus sp. YYML68]|uniref:GerW family sporulation protein n=1 Tax=Paenibacillus sp. YYML68 TaxID=2909250 RepID=UPI002490722B|nr:GerW family sporulation protein [Paenibacillus sp. YYML68]
MTEHPIQGLMKTAMENIKEMVDVNTIVGDPVETPDGSVIMPISKVGFGFAAGGSEFIIEEPAQGASAARTDAHNASVALPFGGGSGGGVSITPIAFLVVGKQGVKIVPLDNQTHLLERLIDSAPQVVDRIQTMMKGKQSGSASQGMGASGMNSTTDSTMGATAAQNSQANQTSQSDNKNFIV